MTTTETQSAPAPKPSITEQANANIAAAKTGTDPLKPLRYAIAFTKGTVSGTLNDMAKWGSKGMYYGAAVGLVVGIAAPWLLGGAAAGVAGTLLTAGAVALSSFAVGLVGGGAHGLATGGKRAMGRMHRAEKYAEDLIVRDEQQRSAPVNTADYRRTRAAAQRHYDFQALRQFMERQREIERDARTFSTAPSVPSYSLSTAPSSSLSWAERVSNEKNQQSNDIWL